MNQTIIHIAMMNWLETITRELTFALAKKGEKKEEAQ